MKVDIGAQQETVVPRVNSDQSIINTSDQLHRRNIHKDSNKLSTEKKFITKHETNDAPSNSRGNIDASILSSLINQTLPSIEMKNNASYFLNIEEREVDGKQRYA